MIIRWFGLRSRKGEHRFALGWFGLAGIIWEERGLCRIGGRLTPWWQLEAGLTELIICNVGRPWARVLLRSARACGGKASSIATD